MKDDKREILYRFRANKAESSMIEARYIQSSCSSISEFFRQIVINDMIVQNSEEELKNLNLLLKSIAQSVDKLSEESCTHSAKIQEVWKLNYQASSMCSWSLKTEERVFF